MGDYITINEREQWHFQRNDDGGVEVELQRRGAAGWQTMERYYRTDAPAIAAHYQNFRAKFRDDPIYRKQFLVTKEKPMNGNGNGHHEPQGFHEAPASPTARMISPQGVEWLLTARDGRVGGLLEKVTYMEDHLLKHGWRPAGGKSQTADNGAGEATPVCQYHGEMKPSSKAPGTFYCPSKMGDGSYCKSKA